jgi:hypothetical protein
MLSSAFVAACGWDPSRPFEREAPEVREAITHLDAGDAASAGSLLEQYLATGQCKEGSIGTPPRVRERANGGFDLGLALFQLAERYGKPFGEEEIDSGVADDAMKAQRAEQVDCALKVVRAIATDTSQPVELRARARYLEGNLLFLNAGYEEAVRAYDATLELAPGMHDSGPIGVGDAGREYSPDLLGREAAWNRAIALRRIEDKKDAGQDASSDASNDGGGDGGGEKDKSGDKDSGDNNKPDAGHDGGGQDSGAKDSGGGDDQEPKPKPPEPKPEPSAPPPSRQSQDERMLDQLENAPTVQQEAARKQAQRRKVRGMSDK